MNNTTTKADIVRTPVLNAGTEAALKGEVPAVKLSNDETAIFMRNELTSRAELWRNLLDIGKNINISCGYPETISVTMYKTLYDREGVAKRVVTVEAGESWSVKPIINENDTPDRTEFETAWDELDEDFECLTYLQRLDELSGIGRFGAMLLGFSDGQSDLSKEVATSDNIELLYLRAFDESRIQVTQTETDVTNKRYGFPVMYSIKFETEATANSTVTLTEKKVHWTRLLHVADNLESSETYGVPRMQQVYNRLLDIRKILSGSGEMFWKGAFPGYVFEVNPDLKNPNLDADSLRAEFDKYSEGLQRYLALEGVSAKSLTPQISDPVQHLDAQLNSIAMTLGIPKRIFMGAEQAKLASTTDKETWNSRLENRQKKHITPRLIKPFIKRMQEYGVLPGARFFVVWPDLNTRSDKEKAEVGLLKTKTMGEYVQKEVHQVIPPTEFMRITLKYSEKEVKAITDAAEKWAKEDDHKQLGVEEPEPILDGQPTAGSLEAVEKSSDKAVRGNA